MSQGHKYQALQNDDNGKKVIIFDMDGTLIRDVRCDDSYVPENYFIEGGLELIKTLKDSGFVVSIVSHSYSYSNIKRVQLALAEMNVNIDSIVYMADIDNSAPTTFIEQQKMQDFLLPIYGKHKSAKMAKIALEKASIDSESYPGMQVVVVGDDWTDLMFAKHIRDRFGCQASAIHINDIKSPLSVGRMGHAESTMLNLLNEGIDIRVASTFQAVYQIIENQFGIDLGVPTYVQSGEEKLGSTKEFSNNIHYVGARRRGVSGQGNLQIQHTNGTALSWLERAKAANPCPSCTIV